MLEAPPGIDDNVEQFRIDIELHCAATINDKLLVVTLDGSSTELTGALKPLNFTEALLVSPLSEFMTRRMRAFAKHVKIQTHGAGRMNRQCAKSAWSVFAVSLTRS